MLSPHAGESQQDFLARFMGSSDALSNYADDRNRAAVAYSIYKQRANAVDTKWTDLDDDEREALTKIMSEPAKPRQNDIPDSASCSTCGHKYRVHGSASNGWKDTECDIEGCSCTEFKSEPAKPRANTSTVSCPKCGKTIDKNFLRFKSHLEKDHGINTQGTQYDIVKSLWTESGGGERTNSRGQAGKTVPMRFIEPGLVNYSDTGMVLVKKETLDKMLPSIKGKPIFNESHKDVSDDDFTKGKAQGIIAGNLRFNPDDGWFWADGLIWDNETLKNGRDGYSLSCAYDVRRWGPGGVHNNIPYDREVLEGEYTHLAIVNNPRYEGARLIINQGGAMKLKFWQKSKEKPEEQVASEVELANSKLEVEGKEVGLEDVIAGFKADEARKALANSKIEMDTLIEIDGKKVKVSELVAGFKSNLANASDDEEKEKKEKEERKNAEEKEKAEKEKKDKDDRENAKNEDDHKKGDHSEKPLENCLACKADTARKNAAHFDDLRNARNKGLEEFREPGLKTAAERVEEGNRRYGSVKP